VNGQRRTRAASYRVSERFSDVTRRSPSQTRSEYAPLRGVRVLDLTQMVAGPFAGQLLAALGAEVIIIESRVHLPSRQFGPFAGEPAYNASTNFNHANRGKQSVELNLTTTEGRTLLRHLVSTSDVVLENFSRRAAQKLGVTYDELKEVREDLIVASI